MFGNIPLPSLPAMCAQHPSLRTVRGWPRAARHAFVAAAFAATLPLFVEPFLRSLSL